MATRYVHTNIISADWRALSQFYVDVLDCVPVPPERDQSGDWLDRGTGVPGARLQGIHLRLPGYSDEGPTLEIYAYDEMKAAARPPAANRKGLGHLAFHVDDVAAVLGRALEYGGSGLGEVASAEIASVGTLTFVYLLDPEGNVIELQNWS